MSSTAALHRAEHSANLRQGLALSAGFHLTLAVLLFGVLGLMRQPFVVIEIPTDDRPPHNPVPPPGDPPPGGTSVVVVDPTRYDIVVPVDKDIVEPVAPDSIAEIAPPSGEPGLVGGGETGNGSTKGGGIGTAGEDSFPEPNEPSFADIEPAVVHRVLPEYPDIARQTGAEGEVWVRVLVDQHGTARKVEIERSSPMFDGPALEAVRQWTFRPAIASGNPVAVWIRIPITFRMK